MHSLGREGGFRAVAFSVVLFAIKVVVFEGFFADCVEAVELVEDVHSAHVGFGSEVEN